MMYHVCTNKVCKYIFDRQVGQPIIMFGPNIFIGRTFYGPNVTPSTDDINTYKLHWVREETFNQHKKKKFLIQTTYPAFTPLTNLHSRSLLKLKQSSIGWRGRRLFWALIYRAERRSSRTPSTCSGPQMVGEVSRCTSTSTWTKKPGPGFSDRTRVLFERRRTKTCSAGSPWRTHTVTSPWRKTTAAPVTPMTSRAARASSTRPAGSRWWAVCDDKFNTV